ncbi:hypothetical protein YC2023_101132 [Brassica napus]
MAKATSSLVVPIIFLVMFLSGIHLSKLKPTLHDIVSQNMGGRTCVAVIGMNCVNCRIKCYNNYGNLATAYCDRSGGSPEYYRCQCTFPCGPPKHLNQNKVF